MAFLKSFFISRVKGIPSFLKRYLIFFLEYPYKFNEFIALSFIFIPFVWLIDQILGMFFDGYDLSLYEYYVNFLGYAVGWIWVGAISYFNENQWWAIFWGCIANGVASYWLLITYLFIMKELEIANTKLFFWLLPSSFKERKRFKFIRCPIELLLLTNLKKNNT
jgi:hypothetical protein